ISPFSNTAAIFVSGFSAASLSFLASKRGLYNKIGRRASHIFNALGPSFCGNSGSSGSTTMCFLSLDHPLSLPFRPFSFGAALGSADEGDVSVLMAFLSVEDAVDVADFVEGSTAWASFGAAVVLVLSLNPVFLLVSVFSEESFPSLLEFVARLVFILCFSECTFTSALLARTEVSLVVGDFISALEIFSLIDLAEG
uniref:Uncharacterized protein n=1 Tax=Dicentrarchus labrax TaxID=13489 RepID=A0A8C4NSN2_DICLA